MKIPKILAIPLMLLLVGAVGYLLTRSDRSNLFQTKPSPSPFVYLPKSEITLPTTDKIKVGDVVVNNFYKTATETTTFGDALVYRGSNFHIVYIEQDKFFIISVNDKPFETIVKNAEQQLLNSLGISKDEACKLDVRTTDSTEKNSTEPIKQYKLSFCE